MPVYEYQCKPNGHQFEVRQGVHDVRPTACPECGGEVRRVISPVGIVFKGSGFYATDSRSASSTAAPAKSTENSGTTGDSGGSGVAATSESKETVKSDAKSDAKSETRSASKSDSKSDASTDSRGTTKP